MRSAASITPPVAPKSLPAVVPLAERRVGGLGLRSREVEAAHPDQPASSRVVSTASTSGRPSAAISGPPGLELLGRARHDRHAEDAGRVDRLAARRRSS